MLIQCSIGLVLSNKLNPNPLAPIKAEITAMEKANHNHLVYSN